MKRKNTSGKPGNEDFWQSAADLLLALLLVMLLVISLLMLYLIQLPEKNFQWLWGTEALYGLDDGQGSGLEWRRDDDGGYWVTETNWRDNGGGGGGETTLPSETTVPTETTTPTTPTERYPVAGAGNGEGDEWGKAAVLVTVIDGETKRAIREPNITYELYQVYNNQNRRPVIDLDTIKGTSRYLNVYYPEKIEYHNYKTNQEGLYYLPEKVETGGYYFKQISELEGYDPAEITYFEVDRNYDWSDPFVVSIPLFPSRNTIRVRLTDADTGEYLTEGSFRADAAENIITADGSTRLIAGAEADVFSLQEGREYAESAELFLGSYTLRQNQAPRYYTVVEDVLDITLDKQNGLEPEIHEFTCQKSAIRLHLSDDLSLTTSLSGASFRLTADEVTPQTAVTDAQGSLVFTNLEKNTVYHLSQVTAPEGYRPDSTEYIFYVDGSGRIEGEAAAVAELTNYIPRTVIGLQDILLKGNVSGRNLSLYDQSGELLRTWTSSGSDEVVTGLTEGSYYVLIDDQETSRFDFTVEDANAILAVHRSVWTMQSILSLAALTIVLPLLVYFVVIVTRKLFRRRSR